jgi:hypothetical protein
MYVCILTLDALIPVVGPPHTYNSSDEFNVTFLLGKVHSAPIKANIIYSVAYMHVTCRFKLLFNYWTPIPVIT